MRKYREPTEKELNAEITRLEKILRVYKMDDISKGMDRAGDQTPARRDCENRRKEGRSPKSPQKTGEAGIAEYREE